MSDFTRRVKAALNERRQLRAKELADAAAKKLAELQAVELKATEAGKKAAWTFRDVGPFAPDREHDARVQALRLAVQAGGDIADAELFYQFLTGGAS